MGAIITWGFFLLNEMYSRGSSILLIFLKIFVKFFKNVEIFFKPLYLFITHLMGG